MMKTRALMLLALFALLAITGVALGEGTGDGGIACGDVDEAVSELPGFELSQGTDEKEICLPCDGADDAANAASSPDWEVEYVVPGAETDSRARFAGYVDRLFGVVSDDGLRRNGLAGDQLTGTLRAVYDYLLARVREVAAGQISDTFFSIPESVVPVDALPELFQGEKNYMDVINALFEDCPYDMYWCDLVVQSGFGDDGAYFGFRVAEEFALDTYATNAESIRTAQVSAQNARAVVSQYAAFSDYAKLKAYKEYICAATAYNTPVTLEQTPYGNPWQLIWVFDGDPDTTVVCEGYSKAFQYLCEMSSFAGNIRCCSASGQNHMWNIVAMEDGKNYLVDVTNSDEGTIGQHGDKLFLAGYDVRTDETTYGFDYGWTVLYYSYDGITLSRLPASALELSDTDYTPPENPTAKPVSIALSPSGTVTLARDKTLALAVALEPADARTTLTWQSENPDVATVDGDGVVTPVKAGETVISVRTDNGLSASVVVQVTPVMPTGVAIRSGRKATLYMGNTLSLEAKVTPSLAETTLTWRSSKPEVATVDGNGRVVPKRAGKTKITVETGNGMKASINVSVVDAKKIQLAEGKRITLSVGDEWKLHATVTPMMVVTRLKWKSGNAKVASVSKDGVVKAKKPGKAKITVTTANGKKAAITVTVVAK